MKKKIFLLALISLFFGLKVYSNDLQEKIKQAFSTGNSSQLAVFFNETIELTLLDREEIYSKTQAEIILRNFFSKHPPTQFKVVHMGGKESSKYIIGNLSNTKENFRVTFLLKTVGEKEFIHQLRIEKDYVE